MIRISLVLLSLVIAAIGLVAAQVEPVVETTQQEKASAEQIPEKEAGENSPELSPDESEIHKNIEGFVKAYNAGDAKTIAQFFAPDGQVVTEDGKPSKAWQPFLPSILLAPGRPPVETPRSIR